MKYIVVLSDGMAGRPLEELNGKTTLEAADTPVMDRLAKTAEIGTAAMVPSGMARAVIRRICPSWDMTQTYITLEDLPWKL